MTLSFAKRVERGDSPHKLMMHAVQRAAWIFVIGLFLNAFPRFELATLRIPGVLQRIAICYLVASAIYLYFGTKARIAICVALLAVYWIVMTMVPVPGCGAGSMEMACNFAQWVDSLLLSGHLYSQTKTWDPEGIVSTMPSIVTTMLGVFAGQILRSKLAGEAKAAWMFLAGNVGIAAGLMLATWMPINKQLWTVPYTLLVGGMAFAVFTSCYWLVDLQGWRRFAKPFAVYGVNALAVYVASGIFGDLLWVTGWKATIYDNVFRPFASSANASVAFAFANVLLFYALAWYMHRRNWIIRV
jgi:predicted acyltransferase